MPSKSVVVGSSVGLHARPAALIAEAAGELEQGGRHAVPPQVRYGLGEQVCEPVVEGDRHGSAGERDTGLQGAGDRAQRQDPQTALGDQFQVSGEYLRADREAFVSARRNVVHRVIEQDREKPSIQGRRHWLGHVFRFAPIARRRRGCG